LNCSVPLSVMSPVTEAPSFRSTVSPGSIVPPVKVFELPPLP
jgi:hypothetical protein